MNGIAYSLRFGPFTLDFPELTLAREGGILRLGRRATDILVALVEARGELVSRDALIARVWPDTVVDEGALRVHLSAVRKVLGDGTEGIQYISNEPGRGYRFVATVTRSQSSEPQVASWATDTGHNLPGQITRILGRADIIERLLKQLLDRRCLTVAGPGGIGKRLRSDRRRFQDRLNGHWPGDGECILAFPLQEGIVSQTREEG